MKKRIQKKIWNNFFKINKDTSVLESFVRGFHPRHMKSLKYTHRLFFIKKRNRIMFELNRSMDEIQKKFSELMAME